MNAHSRKNPFDHQSSVARPYSAATFVRTAVGGLRSLALPRRPDRRLLRHYGTLAERPLPPATRTVRIRALRQNPRPVPGRLLFERARGADQMSLQSFVIEHPEATILLDAAVARDIDREVISELPPLMRRTVRPPRSTIPTLDALEEAGVQPDLAIATHAHWDHVSGLLDLPGMPVLLHDEELDWAATGQQAPVGGVRRALAGRPLLGFRLEGPPVLSFERSHDLFGDGSVRFVDLSGHTPGSVGVLVAADDGPALLVGDAAWHGAQIDQLRQKSGFPGCLADEDREQTWRALHRLHVLQEAIHIVPAHDHERTARWRAVAGETG